MTCPQCNGRGEVRGVRQTMLGQMVNVSDLPPLPGRGQDRRDAVRDVPGRRPGRAQAKAAGDDPGGIDEGHQIRLSNEGEAGPRGGPAGSLYVVVHVAPHPALRREGTELYLRGRVSIAQAALGTTVTVPTVDGEEEVEIKPGTQPGTEIRLRGKGVPHLRRVGSRGDLHVSSTSSVPTKLSQDAARAARGVRRGESGEIGQRAAGILDKLRDAAGAAEAARGAGRAAGGLAGARGRGGPRGGRGGQRDPRRVAPGGTSVEPGFELVDEGLGARIDPTPAGDRSRLRAGA